MEGDGKSHILMRPCQTVEVTLIARWTDGLIHLPFWKVPKPMLSKLAWPAKGLRVVSSSDDVKVVPGEVLVSHPSRAKIIKALQHHHWQKALAP